MAEYLNKYDTTAQYTAESNDRASIGETVSLVTLDGKVYYDRSTVKIGDKVYNVVKMPDGKRWLAQNLDWIPDGVTLITSGWSLEPAACYYRFSDQGRGLLYNGASIPLIDEQLSNGWRVATVNDWNNLLSAIGGNTSDNIRKLKSSDTSGIYSWSTPGSDTYGFKLIRTAFYGWDGSSTVWGTDENGYIYMPDRNGELQYRIRFQNSSPADIDAFAYARNSYAVRLVKG